MLMLLEQHLWVVVRVAPRVNNSPPEVTNTDLRGINHLNKFTQRVFVITVITYRVTRQKYQCDLMGMDEASFA